jgi:hypothetical protein
MILLVTYELKGAPGTYGDLIEVLKSKDSWWHYLARTWLVATDETPKELFAELKPFLRSGDHILISGFSAPYQGWLPQKAWKWIHDHEDSATNF